MESLKMYFKRFFLNYCWIGVIVILLTIIVDLNISNQTIVCRAILEFFKTIGISIIVASVFTWASDSYAFVDKIQQLLRSVVVKRDFLSNLDSESKMDALKSLIKPSFFEKRIYTNIEDYYDFYIKKTMEIAEKNVRSDYSINSRIYLDEEKDLLACEQTVNYRLYPTAKGFEEIKVGFTESSASGKVSYVRIFKPDGGVEEKKEEDIELKEAIFDGIKARIGSIDMSKYSEKDKHLIIELKTTEYGYDHWICTSIQALQPTDGLTYRVRCENDIKIVNHDTFGQGVNFNVDRSGKTNEITISTYQWINEGAGISIVASKS